MATDIATATQFLYAGSNPIQVGVAAGTISPIRAAVLSGTVLQVSSAATTALPGVAITVLGHPEVINGILVYRYPTGPQSSYLAPSLGVEITVDGPLGQRVLHTLTWSPRSVVLAPGSSPAIPSSWRYVSFAGLRFSVPANWPCLLYTSRCV